jgi:uncharacterized protein
MPLMSLHTRKAEGRKLLLGVVHLEPLPGSPRYQQREQVLASALRDAEAMMTAGLDGFVVENFGDAPFRRDRVDPTTIAEMTVLATLLRQKVGPDVWMGINVLRNDAQAALAIAAAVGAQLIRINVHTGVMICDQGTIEGRADETLRQHRQLDTKVEIIADVAVKHALTPAGYDLKQSAKDTAYRGLAAGLIVTGSGTGETANLDELRIVRQAVPDRFLMVGSGVTIGNIKEILSIADGVIVGTTLKEDGLVSNPVSVERTKALVEQARAS